MKQIFNTLTSKYLLVAIAILSTNYLQSQSSQELDFIKLMEEYDAQMIQKCDLEKESQNNKIELKMIYNTFEVSDTIIFLKGNYTNGKRNGIWTTYHSNHKPEIITEFINDTIFNLKYFDYSGKKAFEIDSENGLSSSLSKEVFNLAYNVKFFKFNNSGTLYQVIGDSDTKFQENYPNFINRVSSMLLTKEETATVHFWNYAGLLEDSNIIEPGIRKQIHYEYKRDEVFFTSIKANGILIFTNEKNYDRKVIIETYYFLNGNVSEERTFSYFDPKLKNGHWKIFYENGDKKVVVTYKNDKLHGTLKIWDENGELIKHEKYKDGELVEKKI